MRAPIVLFSYQNPQTGDLEIQNETFLASLGVPEAELLAEFPTLKKHVFVLKEKIEQTQQNAVDAIALLDSTRRKGAMVEQYLESWSEPGTPCEQGFNALHPNLADKLAYMLDLRIFPSLSGNVDFLSRVKTLQERHTTPPPEAVSGPSAAPGETSTAA